MFEIAVIAFVFAYPVVLALYLLHAFWGD